jgi:flagellar M-ring protein FliF
MPTFAQTIMQLPTRSKAILAAGALAVIVVLFLMLRLASAPSYAMLSSGLDPAETGKVTTALDEQGIGYELRANGTSVAVEKAKVSQARIALASAGVAASSGSHEGYELFDKQKLGASDFQQKMTQQRALEGEIGQTVEQVEGVSGARVQLVLPEESLFAEEAAPATAAVMLTGSSDTLEPGAVRGMAQLVASSVKGLKTDNVTITDGTGQLLWPQDDAGGAGGAAGASKQAAQMRYERQLQTRLDALLTQTLGPGKGRVQVKADLNVDKTTREELTVTGKAVPEKQVKETEKLRGGGAGGASGTAGAGGNIPTYSAGAGGGGGNSNYNRKSTTVDNVVPKTITKTDVAPGAVNKLQVALVVDKSVPAADFAAIQKAVKGAAGLDTERGDVFEAAQVAFAKPPAEPKAGPVPTSMLGPIKWVGLGLATLVFMFFMTRSLRKREGEALASPSWLTEIEQPVSLAELESPRAGQERPTLVLPPRERDEPTQALDQLMDREPDRVAAQVKSWMSED